LGAGEAAHNVRWEYDAGIGRLSRTWRHQPHKAIDLAILNPLQAVDPDKLVPAECRLYWPELFAVLVIGPNRGARDFN
jgi:hypothetical protein